MIKDIKIDKFAWIGFGATLFTTKRLIQEHSIYLLLLVRVCSHGWLIQFKAADNI